MTSLPGLGRKARRLALMALVVAVTLKLTARVFFAFQVGPSVLLYETSMH